MPQEYSRARRVGDQIQREIALLLQREVKDPRVGMATVSAVEVSSDLAYAKVFVTFLGKEEQSDIDEALKVLDGAKGYLRSQLAKSIRMRQVPELRFLYDASISRGNAMSALIDQAIAKDKSRHEDED